MSEKGSPGGSNTTIIIIAVISTVGSLLLLGGAGLIYRWTRRRRMTRVPTEDLALTSKERKRQTFDIGSIDLTVRRPLLQNVPWSSFSATHSDNAMHDSSFTRQGSYMQAYDTGDGSSLQHQIPSRPSYDTHGRDSVIRLHTGHTILAPAPLPTHATLEDDDSMISPTASSVQFHHSNSSSEPALSRSPTTSDHRQSSEVRKLTPPPETSAHASTSSHITSQNTRTSPPVSSSYTEATPSAPSNTPPPRAEQVSPFSDPQPRSRISTALPTPPVSVSSRSRQTSIRPLPRTPHAVPAGIPSPALTPPPIKCQTADMRIAVLSRTVRSADTSEAGGSGSVSEDDASIYSQASAPHSVWKDLVNPFDSVEDKTPLVSSPVEDVNDFSGFANFVDVTLSRTNSAVDRTRDHGDMEPDRRSVTATTFSPSTTSTPPTAFDRIGSLPPVPRDADLGSPAVMMRMALAQAVEAAHRDSQYYAESTGQTSMGSIWSSGDEDAGKRRQTSGWLGGTGGSIGSSSEVGKGWITSTRTTSPPPS